MMTKIWCVLSLPVLILAACAPQIPSTPTAPATITPGASITLTDSPTSSGTPTDTITPTLVSTTPTPGLVLHGRVRLQDGSGLAGVAICRSYASYPGTVVATTGSLGTFRSDYAFIPGDEMVDVWPLAPGYDFDPPYVYWRHYYGAEDRLLDFVASPASATGVPPGACQ